jgi:hypothetical protein
MIYPVIPAEREAREPGSMDTELTPREILDAIR